jgi:hypothetical protein
MRVLALLVCVGAAACATPALHQTARTPPAPLPPPRYPPTLAHEIIVAQTKTYGDVTPVFDPIAADLMSGDDRLVAAALEVVEGIGTEVAEMARRCPPPRLRCFGDDVDTLVGHIEGLLILLRRKGGCATVVTVERAAKQFDRLPRWLPPQAALDASLIGDVPPNNSLPVRVLVCGMIAVRPKVAACYERHKVPGTVMLNVVIGKNGTVTTAAATGQFADTPTGTCVENAVRTATFPPSDGLSTPYPFVLPPPSPTSGTR